MTKAQIKVLQAVYMATDCSNGVYDYASLHHTQARIADGMPELVTSIDGVVSVDGDGFHLDPERIGRGFRLTRKGYETLTAHDPEGYPAGEGRFEKLADVEKGGGEARSWIGTAE